MKNSSTEKGREDPHEVRSYLLYVLKKMQRKTPYSKDLFEIDLLLTQLLCNEVITYEMNIELHKAINLISRFFLEWGL